MERTRALSRHQILQATAAAALVATPAIGSTTRPPVKAIGFDGFVVFDPGPVAARAEQLFPGRGEALSALWRTRQFEYTWLRTLTGRYVDFWKVTQDALMFAAASKGIALKPDERDALMQVWLELKAWPDALAGLQTLRAAGVRLAFVSNLTEAILDANVASAGLAGLFEQNLSTDRVRAFKPDPRAYHMAVDALGVSQEEIVFAAFGGWDAAGAKSFGFRTFWANRLHQPVEELDARPDAIGETLQDLVGFVTTG